MTPISTRSESGRLRARLLRAHDGAMFIALEVQNSIDKKVLTEDLSILLVMRPSSDPAQARTLLSSIEALCEGLVCVASSPHPLYKLLPASPSGIGLV